MPMWVAPNLITIVGLAVNVFTSLIHMYFCPTATESVSHNYYFWQFILCVKCCFINGWFFSDSVMGAIELCIGPFHLSNPGCH